MVASQYPNHEQPLWNLPGGRQQPRELLAQTVVREIFEETGLRVEAGEVAYVSESYDGDTHFLNVAFRVDVLGGESSFDGACPERSRRAEDDTYLSAKRPELVEGRAVLSEARSAESKGVDDTADHVVAVEWVPIDRVAARIVVGVVREPLLAYLRGELLQRYAGFHDAGITIEWPADSR